MNKTVWGLASLAAMVYGVHLLQGSLVELPMAGTAAESIPLSAPRSPDLPLSESASDPTTRTTGSVKSNARQSPDAPGVLDLLAARSKPPLPVARISTYDLKKLVKDDPYAALHTASVHPNTVKAAISSICAASDDKTIVQCVISQSFQQQDQVHLLRDAVLAGDYLAARQLPWAVLGRPGAASNTESAELELAIYTLATLGGEGDLDAVEDLHSICNVSAACPNRAFTTQVLREFLKTVAPDRAGALALTPVVLGQDELVKAGIKASQLAAAWQSTAR
jgi:hypothetical protein